MAQCYAKSTIVERHDPTIFDVMHLITLPKAAHYIGATEKRLRWLCEQNYAPHIQKEDGTYLFRRKPLREWAERNLVKSEEGRELPRLWPVVVERTSSRARDKPWALQGIEPLHAVPFGLWCDTPVVYFLVQNQAVVYVGQSIQLGGRLAEHLRTKEFDSVFFVCVPRDRLNETEAAFIRALKPELNGNGGADIEDGAVRALLEPYYGSEAPSAAEGGQV